MKNKSPAVLWYTADFLTGTNLMTDEQLGKYTRILCYQHQQGHLSEEDMMMICKTYDKKIFDKFVKDKEGNFFNKRMDLEIEKRNNFSKSRSENRRGNSSKIKEKPKKDMNNICKTYEQHMDNENDNENINIYFNNNKELNSIFEEFLKIRKKLKAVNSERAIKTLLNKLEIYDDQIKYKILEQSIVNSWKDIYPLKEDKPKVTPPEWLDRTIKKGVISVDTEDLLKEFR